MAIPLVSPRFTTPPTAARFAKAANDAPVMKRGELNREAVRLLQQALIDLEYRLPRTMKYGTPDGTFGDETRDAVKAFQTKYLGPAAADGKVGKNTLSKLDDLLPRAGAPLEPLPTTGDTANEILRRAILAVLRGPHMLGVDFVFLGQEVNFGWFHWVERCVERDSIFTICDPRIREFGTGLYVPENAASLGANAFVMPRIHFINWKQRSVVVHEAVHASQDLRGVALQRTIAEGAAFIAQNVYHRLATGARVSDTDPLADAIHVEADKLAKQVVDGTNNIFGILDAIDLGRAILAVPRYQIATYEFDGVPGSEDVAF